MKRVEVVKKRIEQIQRGQCGEQFGGKQVSTEPTREEVLASLAKGELESIAFQDHKNLAERFSPFSGLELIKEIRKYHSGRIAFFMEKGWPEREKLKFVAATFWKREDTDFYPRNIKVKWKSNV